MTKKPMGKPVVDMKTACEIARDTSVSKLTRIEYQVTRHCLKKKSNYMKVPSKSTFSVSSSEIKSLFREGFLGSFKTEITEESGKEAEGDTRNTSQEMIKSDSPDTDLLQREECDESHLEASFMRADIDNEDEKEASKGETKVHERITDKVYTTLSNNFKRIFRSSKSYGCSCGRAKDPDLD